MEFEPLFQGEPLAAFLPPGHALADRPVLKPDDLEAQTLVVFPREANPALHEGSLRGSRMRVIGSPGYEKQAARTHAMSCCRSPKASAWR